jgi:indolepyruvate ferredoxin oxidoreductase alpha subunit
MTRFVVDPSGVLGIAVEGLAIKPGDELLAPTLLRSQVLSTLHEAVARGDLTADEAGQRLDRVDALKIRYLGDRVLRRLAWRIADRQGWSDTYAAEYLALTQLQGDALLTLDADLRRRAEGVVEFATLEDLR